MEYGEFRERVEDLGNVLEDIYVHIGKLCMRLPLPISVPPIKADGDRGLLEDEGAALAEVVDRARSAVLDLPMDDVTAAALNTLMIEWLSTRELLAQAHSGPQRDYLVFSAALACERMDRIEDYLDDQL
ncbi:hypothetical protein ACWDRB_61145 [Nonomuraea sp. NPDC003707]